MNKKNKKNKKTNMDYDGQFLVFKAGFIALIVYIAITGINEGLIQLTNDYTTISLPYLTSQQVFIVTIFAFIAVNFIYSDIDEKIFKISRSLKQSCIVTAFFAVGLMFKGHLFTIKGILVVVAFYIILAIIIMLLKYLTKLIWYKLNKHVE